MSLITTQLFEGPQARLELDAGEIRVVAGPDRGSRFALGINSVLIGSGPECDLVLHDATVSARHAEIIATSRGYVIRDLMSTNGVLLGPHAIERAPLCDGMRLGLGQSALSVSPSRAGIRRASSSASAS